jgi:transposase InsO family protein
LSELGLQLRNKTPKRRLKAKLRGISSKPRNRTRTWAMDFVHDQLAMGRKIRILTVVDTFSRYAPIVDPRFSYRAEDVVGTLELSQRATPTRSNRAESPDIIGSSRWHPRARYRDIGRKI